MARLEERDYTYFTTVRGMCSRCRAVVPARVFFRDGSVWQESLCPDCRNEPTIIALDQEWYLANIHRSFPDCSPIQGSHQAKQGCPSDCGPCSWHATPFASAIIHTRGFNLDECVARVEPVSEIYGQVKQIVITGVDEKPVTDITGMLDACNRTGILNVVLQVDVTGMNLQNMRMLSDNGASVRLRVDWHEHRIDQGLKQMQETRCISELLVEAHGQPIDKIINDICQASQGVLAPEQFVPSNGAHPLCSATAILDQPDASSESVRRVSLHTPMDAPSFDCSRLMLCPNAILDDNGKLLPLCSHNLIQSRKELSGTGDV